MNVELTALDSQVKHLFADLVAFLGYVWTWPIAADCIKPGTYDVDDELLAARSPLDISAKLAELQQQFDQLKRQRPLLEKFSRDIPLEWIAENSNWHELPDSMPTKDFLNEIQRRPLGNLHTAIVDGASRCLLDLQLAKTVEAKCVAAKNWREAMGILTQGDSVWRRLYCEVLVGASKDEHPTSQQRTKAVSTLASFDEASLDEKAVVVKFQNPDWTDQQVADAIGCARETLFKENMIQYKQAKAALKSGRQKYRGDKAGDRRRRPSNIDRRDRVSE